MAAPEPPQSPSSTDVADTQGSWVSAYNVPGATKVIDAREGKAVQGICLSGGGVRSACVAMGVMQIFAAADPIDPAEPAEQSGPRLIDTVDYVISVSGGGFTAGALLMATQPAKTITDKPRVSQRFEDGSPEFDWFRRHSSYIADSPAALIRALAEVLKNLLASMLILFTVPVLAGWVTGYLLASPYFSFAAFVPVPHPQFDTAIKPKHPDYLMSLVDHPSSWWAVVFFGVFAVSLMMSAIFVEWLSSGPISEAVRGWMSRTARASAMFALLVLTVIAGLPALMRLCSMISLNAGHNSGKTAATITGVIGLNYLTAVVAMAWKKRGALPLGDLTRPSWWKRLLPPEVLQLTLVLLTLAVLSVVWLVSLGSFAAGVFRQVTINGYQATISNVPNWQIWLGGLLSTIVFLGLVDVTSLSLHPFYRRKLAGTFAVRRERVSPAVKRWRAQPYPASEWTWLPDYGRVPARGPRFVFAAAATLSGPAKPAPGLNAVSYVLSADYLGGPELGWFKTPALFDEAPPRIKRDLTVQASIAVSGAAFASAMGRQDKGFEKLLAVSGARLGTWLPNPKFVSKLACAQHEQCADERDNTRPWPKSLPTIRGAGYFYRELFGMNYADARLVQLSDGGHYENLGLVEGLRRRCRLIFCIDGGGDTPPLLSGLGDAMRLAEYELGVTITLDSRGDYAVDTIAPGSGTPFGAGHALVCLNSRLTKGTVVAGTISYPAAAGLPDSQGILIFAKAVLWQGCPEWLLTYAASSDVFPHDSTADQWFNEGQFAAYTQLGRIMGTHAMECVQTLRRTGRL
jgi:Patatin-like phospholipase